MTFRRSFAFMGALALLAACGQKQQEAAAPAEQPAAAAAAAPTDNAVISGSVKFAGAKPKVATINMSADAYCKSQHSTTVTAEDAVVNPNGTLKWAYVYVKSGLGDKTFPAPTTPVELDQVGCTYVPHVLAAQVGQEIVIKNTDAVLHNVNARPKDNQGFNFGQPVKDMVTKKVFTKPEVAIPFKCDVHPWMSAWIAVQPHPFATVTDENGAFSLKGLPAGTYEIAVWHEKFGTTTQTISIGANETKTADFTIKG